MGCETKTRKIGERQWTVTQMPATQSLLIQAQLAPILASVGGDLYRVSKGGGQAIVEALGAAAGAIQAHLPPDKFLQLAKDLTENGLVQVEGRTIGSTNSFDAVFSGDDMVDLYRVIWFVLEVNYAGFFGALGLTGVMERAKAKMAEGAQSQAQTSSESPQT